VSVKQKQLEEQREGLATSGVATRNIVFAFKLEGFSGRVRVYLAVGSRLFDVREVEVEEGKPVQVRMRAPAGARMVRVVVADEEDNVLLDKTVALPPPTDEEQRVALTPGLEKWLGVGVQEGEAVAAKLQELVPPEILAQLEQLVQEQQQLEQQVQQVKQAAAQESQE
jgi:hypothetical protein